MNIDEAITFAEKNGYNQEVIERLKDYRALLMLLAKGNKNYQDCHSVPKPSNGVPTKNMV